MFIKAGTKLICLDAVGSDITKSDDGLFQLTVGGVYTAASDSSDGYVQLVEAKGIAYRATRFENFPKHKLVYLAGPYSKYQNKDALMTAIMTVSGMYQMQNAGHHVVSPLFNHFSLAHVPSMGSDYAFWGDYSRNLLARCDKLIVIMFPGWDESTGVADEVKTAQAAGIEVEFVDPRTFGYDTAVFAALLK